MRMNLISGICIKHDVHKSSQEWSLIKNNFAKTYGWKDGGVLLKIKDLYWLIQLFEEFSISFIFEKLLGIF